MSASSSSGILDWDLLRQSGWQGSWDPNRATSAGETPLWWAASHHPEYVAPLLAAGARWAEAGKDGWPVLWAASYGNPAERSGLPPETNERYVSAARALLAAGADPNEPNADGESLLATVAEFAPEMVPVLLEAGAEVEGVDQRGRSALAATLSRGHETAYRQLLTAGASPNTYASCEEVLDRVARKPMVFALLIEAPGVDLEPLETWIRNHPVDADNPANRGRWAVKHALEAYRLENALPEAAPAGRKMRL